MGYQIWIQENLKSLGVTAPPQAIEELMRVSNGGVLDHLDRAAFDAAVELAAGRKEITILRDRRGGTTKNLSLQQLREEIESGARWPNDDWRSDSCSCMGRLF